MWKIIPNTNNLYECNKGGQIRRVKGVVDFGSQRRNVGGTPLKPKTKKNGYKEVSLNFGLNKNGTSKYVHRLIAQTFLGDIPKGHNVNHKDGNKSNNSLSNLEIVTFSENQKHAYKLGLIKNNPQKGSKHFLSKTTEEEVLKIRQKHSLLKSLNKVALLFPHIPKSTLGKIVYRNTWKHI